MADEEQTSTDEEQSRPDEGQTLTEKPEVTDEHKETAKKMKESYEEERPTISMPGTDGAVSGTAVNEWVDDDGNPKFSDKDKDGS